MELKVKNNDMEVTWSISGQLTYKDHTEFRAFLLDCENHKTRKITIELDDLTFIDSAGMGMFLLTIERLRPFNCEIIFQNPNGQVLKMIELANIATMATIEKINK